MPIITTPLCEFELRPDETLLEALERTGHHIEYQCRSGYCGSCRVKLLSGHVSYSELPMAFVMSQEILPCCCKVESDLCLDLPFSTHQPTQDNIK